MALKLAPWPGIEPGLFLINSQTPTPCLLSRNKNMSLQAYCPVRGDVCMFFCSKHSKTHLQSLSLCWSQHPLWIVCFRMPCIATRHDRVNTLPRSLTSALSLHVHVFCPPV